MYPQLSFRANTRRRATPLLPNWNYSCRSVGTVSCALPVTTNVTISTSVSQIMCYWIAIFHLRQPLSFLSHSLYGMPEFAPLINVLFWGRCDFHICFSGRERLKFSLRKFYDWYWDLIKHNEVSVSQILHAILWHNHIQLHPLLIRHFTKSWPCYRNGP